MELTITQQRALEAISNGISRGIHHATLKSVIRLGLVEVADPRGHRLTPAGWDLVADCGGEEVLDAELAEVDTELGAVAVIEPTTVIEPTVIHTTMVPLAEALKRLAPLVLQSKRERRKADRKADRKARRLAHRTQLAVRGRVSSRVGQEAARRVKPVVDPRADAAEYRDEQLDRG